MAVLRRFSRRRRDEIQSRPTVPGYEVVAPTGFGAAGAVWSARDRAGRPVVVQFVRLPPGERGAALLRRLEALRATAHPHLPMVLDVVGLEEGRCALVTEEVVGPSLATVRTARGPLSPGQAVTLLTAIASALARLHEKGVIHGDVAPANVLIAAGGVPVLVDLAGEVTHERGTPGFVAPERRVGGPASTTADVWALAQTVRWAAGDDPDVDRTLRPALSPDPRERPGARTLAQVAATLGPPEELAPGDEADLAQARLRSASALTELANTRRPRGRHRRRGRMRRTGVAVLIGVVAVGAVSGMTARWASGSEQIDEAAAAAAVERLVSARDEALMAGDVRALAELSVPGSDVAEADAELLAGLGETGVRPDGLHTEVHSVRLLSPDSSPEGPWRAEVVTRQGEYVLTGSGAHGETPVPAQEPRCTVMEIVGPAWRISNVESCT